MTAPHWQVEIVHPVTGKPKVWAAYASRELAEVEAAKLRVHKMFAQVRRVDDVEQAEQPEHNGDRRRFLIWAAMLGAVPPERVVERIVAEIEQEAQT